MIPARGGSKGIKRKNLKLLAGLPLVAHTINASLKSKYITRTVVSTEDEEIKETALQFKSEVVTRPMHLASDTAKTAPVLLDVLEQLEKKENYVPDVVILLQPTCPLRSEKEIDKAFEIFFSSENCDSVFSALPIGITHSKWKMLHDGSLHALYDFRNRPRRQDEKEHYKMFTETGSIYIIKTETMRKCKDFIGEKPKLFLEDCCCDIDNIDDFKIAEDILKRRSS